MNARLRLLVSGLACGFGLFAFSATASAQVLLDEDFEDSDASGWTVNGVPTIYTDQGNPGNYLVLPLDAYEGVSLSARGPESMVLGDLTTGGPLRLSFDVRTFAAYTFFEDNLDMHLWPLVFELTDQNAEGINIASVYTIKGTWTNIKEGWVRVSLDLPDPTSTTLPPDWGGTGDEDPVTFEPRLPPGVTYADVLSSVDEVRVTTFVPGYFYASNFYEVGFDNVRVELVGGECRADFNNDANVNSQDFFDFLTAFFAQDPSADFNGDESINSQDFFDFIAAFFAGC